MHGTQKLFRAVSKKELEDWQQTEIFRTALNTLEAKQFFKTIEAVEDFVYHSKKQFFSPPYTYIFEIAVEKKCLEGLSIYEVELDRFDAINVHEDDLHAFNKCIKFVTHHAI